VGLSATSRHGGGPSATGGSPLHRAQGSRPGAHGTPARRVRARRRHEPRGWDRAVRWDDGRVRRFFSHLAAACAAPLPAGLAGQDGREFRTTPRGRARTRWEGVFVHEALKVLGPCSGDLRGATGAGAIHHTLDPLVREALDPRAQGGSGNVPRVGHRGEALACDDLAHGLGPTEAPGFLGLLARGSSGGEGLIRKGECARPPCGVSRQKLRQKFTRPSCLLIRLSEQHLFDSNCPGAAHCGTVCAI
jgi:hypothetical protein